ncbi:gamma-aminobutyric acid type B receptor subunit 2-like, partial [Stegastes partitus]|uniref:Gamma-aminobutyric acid type B receptor subunit 2 n=1 Tax=Stegastes partitus TaxID=144197 RepID=A0A9Y4NV20_9TELE
EICIKDSRKFHNPLRFTLSRMEAKCQDRHLLKPCLKGLQQVTRLLYGAMDELWATSAGTCPPSGSCSPEDTSRGATAPCGLQSAFSRLRLRRITEFLCRSRAGEAGMGLCGRLLLLLGFCWLSLGSVLAQVRHPLPVLWMMPLSSGSGRQNLTAGVVPAVQLALQDLKKQPPPLGDYEVQLQLLDSQCDPAKALKALFDAMWAGPKYLLLIGGVCPPVTALIARSLPALHLVQVSFAASSPSLSNRKWFGNLFSTMPSDRALNQAAVKLLQRFRWARVGVVTQEGPRLSEMKKDLIRQLLKADVQLVASESFSSDVCSSLKKLKDRDVRIIITHFEDDSASEVFCCAYRLNLFGPRYQWIVSGGGSGWRLGWKVSGCSANSLLTAAYGSIRLQSRQLSSTNIAGVSGRTPQDYQDTYLRHLDQNSELSPLHSFAYDAVWVAARALVQAMEAQKQRQKYSRNVTVGEEAAERTLVEALKSSQFQGVTGPVSFRHGERMTLIELIQFQGSSGVLVGEFNTSNQQLRLINHLLRFKGGTPARDQPEVRRQQRQVDPADPGVLIHPFSKHCSSTNMETWISAVCTYKAPLLGLGCFVSWSIRAADVPLVRLLVLTVFAVTVFSVSGLSGSLLTSHDPTVQLFVSGVLVLCCNVFILVGLFAPKVVSVCLRGSDLQLPTELQSEAAEDEDLQSRLKLQLQSQVAQLDVQIETIIMQLCEESEFETLHRLTKEKPGDRQHHVTQKGCKHRCVRWTHEAQVCAGIRTSETGASGAEDINSPEHVGRRLSVQLPILHHSYLPIIGGVSSSSSSSLFGSRDAFLYHHDNFLYA